VNGTHLALADDSRFVFKVGRDESKLPGGAKNTSQTLHNYNGAYTSRR